MHRRRRRRRVIREEVKKKKKNRNKSKIRFRRACLLYEGLLVSGAGLDRGSRLGVLLAAPHGEVPEEEGAAEGSHGKLYIWVNNGTLGCGVGEKGRIESGGRGEEDREER